MTSPPEDLGPGDAVPDGDLAREDPAPDGTLAPEDLAHDDVAPEDLARDGVASDPALDRSSERAPEEPDRDPLEQEYEHPKVAATGAGSTVTPAGVPETSAHPEVATASEDAEAFRARWTDVQFGLSTRRVKQSTKVTGWWPNSCSTWPERSPKSVADWRANGTRALTSPPRTCAPPSNATVCSSSASSQPDRDSSSRHRRRGAGGLPQPAPRHAGTTGGFAHARRTGSRQCIPTSQLLSGPASVDTNKDDAEVEARNPTRRTRSTPCGPPACRSQHLPSGRRRDSDPVWPRLPCRGQAEQQHPSQSVVRPLRRSSATGPPSRPRWATARARW